MLSIFRLRRWLVPASMAPLLLLSPAVAAVSGMGGGSAAANPHVIQIERNSERESFTRTEFRQPCRDYDPLRRPWFGDTHVHTMWSFDASAQDTRNTPADAYAFARGGPMRIQPYDDDGAGLREIRIDRPLDFAAVTDHSEFLGEILMCATEGAPGYYHPVCLAHRHAPSLTQLAFGGMGLSLKRRWGFCGEYDQECLDWARNTWAQIRQDAEDAYDRSDECSFTSFIGYEWTSTVGRGTNMHHNVIFRNSQVPKRPISWMDTPNLASLWRHLEIECSERLPGCDAVAIPHNTNLSRGLMFGSPYTSTSEEPAEPVSREDARRRAHWSPLIEVMQHKGSSECDSRHAQWAGDEFCDFEKLPYDTFGTKNTGDDGTGMLFLMKKLFGGDEFTSIEPPPATAYVRHGLLQGLRQRAEIGVNGFQYGLIASTDTHVAAPGLVMEKNHPGHGGAGMDSRDGLRTGLPDELEFNPGGLAVLYAEENSRDALFAAMRRREAYGTSGTRPLVRVFGGWDYPADLCASPDLVARGYAGGVPMGGDLPAPPDEGESRPRLVVWAQADPGTPDYPGSKLQRIQVVKGWYENGELREQVRDVAGGANGAAVDLDSCAQSGPGHEQLCAVWEDEDFDPGATAFYYARVLENPSCRWSQQICMAEQVSCADPDALPEGFRQCCAPEHRKTVQERAWSSPIWYSPPG